LNKSLAPAWRVHLDVPAAALPALEAALAPLGGALVTGGPDPAGLVPVDLYLGAAPDRAALTARLAAIGAPLPEAAIEPLGARDWVAENRAALPAIQAGPFYVYGAHITDPPPPGSIPLRVEASAAFGTGRHESTRGCLLALADLAARERPVARALDMGCGTGILAMAVARLWGCPVTAVDSDANAARLCAENARVNDLAALVHAERGDGYQSPAVARHAPFDLIVANILAEPLCAMAPDLRRHLAPGGVAILSGLLATQAAPVLARHRPLVVRARVPLGDWVTLVLGEPITIS